jgi:pimeloyl-ACP methyl ester carboxylesterase
VIVVMPFGGAAGFYTDWADGSQGWDTYHTKTLVEHIDATYRTIADRAHRAVAGESMGGYGAAHYAARHPDLFAAVGSFTGAVDITDKGAPSLALWSGVTGPYGAGCAGGDGTPAWGNPVTDEIGWHNHNPTDLAVNLGATSVYVGVANGVPCDAQDVERYPAIHPTFEPGLYDMNRNFDAALTAAGVAHTSEFLACGTHDFRYVNHYLHSFWPQMLAAFGSPAPAAFDYRAADPSFSVWDWTFAAEPARPAEFLDVADASCAGVGLTGSGPITVTTAPCFSDGDTVALAGATDDEATADDEGRITFTVDLGAAHTNQQYMPAARALEAAGGYWTSRVVRFATEG